MVTYFAGASSAPVGLGGVDTAGARSFDIVEAAGEGLCDKEPEFTLTSIAESVAGPLSMFDVFALFAVVSFAGVSLAAASTGTEAALDKGELPVLISVCPDVLGLRGRLRSPSLTGSITGGATCESDMP